MKKSTLFVIALSAIAVVAAVAVSNQNANQETASNTEQQQDLNQISPASGMDSSEASSSDEQSGNEQPAVAPAGEGAEPSGGELPNTNQ